MLITIVVAIATAAFVALGWMLDRRAARRREDDAMTDGIFVGKLIGRLSEQDKSEMFADVMASHRASQTPIQCRIWHDWYGACELPYRHDGPHSRVPGGATEPNTWEL